MNYEADRCDVANGTNARAMTIRGLETINTLSTSANTYIRGGGVVLLHGHFGKKNVCVLAGIGMRLSNFGAIRTPSSAAFRESAECREFAIAIGK